MANHSSPVSLDVAALFPDCPSSDGLILDLDPGTMSVTETPEALRFTIHGTLRDAHETEESL